jgi:hypothetical protein
MIALQPQEKVPTPAQQSAMYAEVCQRDARVLANHYKRLCIETNMTWPGYQDDCYTAALSEVEARYG